MIARQALGVRVVRQHLDDAALFDPAAAALTDHALEFGTQSLKPRDLRLDIREYLLRDTVNPCTRRRALVDQTKQLPHCFKTESQFARVADKSETVGMALCIAPLAAAGTTRRRHQRLLFVIADGLRVRHRALREIADREKLKRHR
jgi:hypothetical protein